MSKFLLCMKMRWTYLFVLEDVLLHYVERGEERPMLGEPVVSKFLEGDAWLGVDEDGHPDGVLAERWLLC